MEILTRLQMVMETIDSMIRDGIIGTYALGGATAANIYVQAFNTRDFDFFVSILGDVPTLDPLRPIIDYLKPRGYTLDGPSPRSTD